MIANCSRLFGLQSTLAPTSTRMAAVPAAVGNTAASAGRSTPGSVPRIILAVAMAAPAYRDAHGGIGLGAQRLGGFVLHGNTVAGVNCFDRQARRLRVVG